MQLKTLLTGGYSEANRIRKHVSSSMTENERLMHAFSDLPQNRPWISKTLPLTVIKLNDPFARHSQTDFDIFPIKE